MSRSWPHGTLLPPHAWCYDCDNYGHVAVDCPDKILLSGTLAHCRTDTNDRHEGSCCRHHSHTRCIHTMITRIDPDSVSSQSCPHNHRYRSSSHQDHHRSHSRSFHRPSCCSFSHHRSSSSYCYCQDIPHCKPSSHRNTSQDDSRSRHKSPQATLQTSLQILVHFTSISLET